MSRRSVWLGVACTAMACGRGSGRAPAASPPAPQTATPAPTPAAAAADTARPPGKDSLPITIPVLPAATDTAAKPPAKRAERPAQRCTLDFENTPETRAQSIRDPISQKYTTYIGGGVIGICRGQATRIVGDSAESYEQNRLHYLIGHVKYRDDQVVLDADRVTYFQGEERLLAEGNVVVTMKDSSSMTGPRAEYLRAVRGVRPASRVLMNARPTLRMYETDSAGKRQPDPVVLIADNIVGEGESLFVANGNVQLDRVDLKARGDSGLLDNVRQYARLMKGPQVESKGSQPFTLTGRIVDVFGRSRRIERVLSLDSAQAVSKDLTLTADTLDLRVTENKLNRAYAFGAGQANAVTPERRIVADSLDVVMPNQRLRELHAVGSAYADSDPDSAKITSTDRDWMRGDTIVARFDTVARDTTSQPALRDLKASGNASSFYQMPSQRGDKQRPGLSYVRGREITIDFNDREVQTVAVTDSVAGVFLEASPPVDSSKVDAKPSNRRRTPARPPARGTTPVRRPGGPRE